ncbi:MAG: hypothetical protein AB1746_02295 [Candidatus Zixiibacteriota bacterium]
MKIHKITWMLPAVVALVCLLYVPGAAWQVNEHYTNNTGQTAYDLTKILLGNVICTDTMMNQPFASFTHMPFGSFTFFHWYDGTVAPGQQGHACFSTNAPLIPPFAAFWTDQDGHFIGLAGPVVMPSIDYNSQTGEITFKIGNEWKNWTGAGFPPQTGDAPGGNVGDVTIIDAFYTLEPNGYDLEQLDSASLGGLNWFQIPGLVDLVVDTMDEAVAVVTPDPAYIAENSQILFMFYVEGGGQQAYNVVQRTIYHQKVPSLTSWGLAVIILLLIISTIVVIYNRRRRAIM